MLQSRRARYWPRSSCICRSQETSGEHLATHVGLPARRAKALMSTQALFKITTPKLTSAANASDTRTQVGEGAAQAQLQASLKTVPLTLRAVLGRAELTKAELTGLRRGDVIRLDTFIRQDLTVWVRDREFFSARAGTSGKHLAVQITGREAPESANEAEP